MLLLSKAELEELDPPGPRDMLWAIIALPLVMTQLGVSIYRIWKGFSGEPLLISKIFEISVQWSDSQTQFTLGLAFYAILIAFLFVMIWACIFSIKHCLYYRRHHTNPPTNFSNR